MQHHSSSQLDGQNNNNSFDLADLIANQPTHRERLKLFNSLHPQQAVHVFEYLPFPVQKSIISALPSDKISVLLDELSPDDRTAFLENLPKEVANHLIKFLSSKERAITLNLLGYPEGSIGRLMTPDYIAVKMNWSVGKVLNYIREHGHDSETINIIYVINDQGVLIDDIRIRELLVIPLDKKIEAITDHKFTALSVYEDEEHAVSTFRKHDRVALPVIDNQGVLLGIVTIDDILHVVEEEDTEDMQKIAGMEALDEPYMETPFLRLMQKRVGWLVVLFLGEMLTASALGYFQDEISRAVVLALFIPLIISSGGNSGSQACTLIIRAMALGEVKLRDWARIMRREILAGLFLGVILGAIGFLRVSAWSLFSDIYGPHWLLIAITIFLSLVGVVLWGTISGSMLPLILKRFGCDPAVSSAPFIATIVDVVGLIIYFNIAWIILRSAMM